MKDEELDRLIAEEMEKLGQDYELATYDPTSLGERSGEHIELVSGYPIDSPYVAIPDSAAPPPVIYTRADVAVKAFFKELREYLAKIDADTVIWRIPPEGDRQDGFSWETWIVADRERAPFPIFKLYARFVAQ